ncbi:SDR family NAD(P)-dependent oxidoreductase [Flavobacterium sp. F52]|uniref:SDR family NAD(P)-dependent oxidoreductase n=1 Tax=Flavobacterium sp. F52 TaxID=1202532 RepID=UPI000272DBE1|nr:SDR family NAD(P)-dependent oxidoreductase [Flavobacterium sp. F52]EJG03187.1 short chain dehydrogenase [Flavobacterium sp. F52]
MTNSKKILITGAESHLGQGTALGLAALGHKVIAGVQASSKTAELRKRAQELGITGNLLVEKLDIISNTDLNYAMEWDIDILVINTEAAQTAPVFEVPLELVRANFEINVIAPLRLSQKFISKWIKQGKKGKIIFISPLSSRMLTSKETGIYSSTRHAAESIAEVLKDELKPHGIKIQTINTGLSQTAINANGLGHDFEKKTFLTNQSRTDSGSLNSSFFDANFDPQEIIENIIDIVPQQHGRFRNIVPAYVKDLLKEHQIYAWNEFM